MAKIFESDSEELDIPDVGCQTSMSLYLNRLKLVNLQAAPMSLRMKLA